VPLLICMPDSCPCGELATDVASHVDVCLDTGVDALFEALAAGLAITTFLVGFSSIRLRSDRDRALSRSDAVIADLGRAGTANRAISDREVTAAAEGLVEADRKDPIGQWTIAVNFVIAGAMVALSVISSARTDSVFSLNPREWNSDTWSILFFVFAEAAVGLLGLWDYRWVGKDLRTRRSVSPVFLASRAIELEKKGSAAEALAQVDRLTDRLPSWPWAHAFRSHILMKLKRYSDALEAIDRAIALEPVNDWWKVARAELHLKTMRYADALSDIESLDQTILRSASIGAIHGACLYGVGRRTEAISAFDRAIGLDPGDEQRRMSRGQALLGVGVRHDVVESPSLAFVDMLLDDGKRVALQTITRVGAVRLAERDAVSATADFDFVVKKQPTNAMAYAWRATAKYQIGDSTAAELDFATAISLGASPAEIHRMRGRALDDQGWITRAEVEYTTAIDTDPSASALYGRAMVRLQLQNFLGALDDFDSVLLLEPTDVDAMAHRAETLAALGKILDSEAAFTDAETSVPGLPHTYFVWLRTLLRTNRAQHAERVLARALSANMSPRDRVMMLAIGGSVYAALRLYSRALDSFDEADRLVPTSPEIAYRRGLCLAGMGEFPRAIDAISRSAETAWSHQFAALASRSAMQRATGLVAPALSDIDRAIELAPEESKLMVSRGCLRASLGEFERALADYTAALELDNSDDNALTHRIYVRIAIGALAGIDEDLARLDELLGSDNVAVIEARASYRFAQQDWRGAIEAYRQLLSDRSGDSDALFALGAAYVNSSEFREAEEIFSLIVRGDADAFTARAAMAVAISLQGRTDEAVSLLAQLRREDENALVGWVSTLSPDILPFFELFMADWNKSVFPDTQVDSPRSVI
jgi:tetratricopeptide (TPR) repeat protein